MISINYCLAGSDIDTIDMSGDGDDVSDDDDEHFIIYSSIAIQKALSNVTSVEDFTPEYWTNLVANTDVSARRTLLNSASQMTCKMEIPQNTCVRIGNPPAATSPPSTDEFLSMFVRGNRLVRVARTMTSFCRFALFEVFHEQRLLSNTNVTSVGSFCSLTDDVEIELQTTDRDEIYYFQYRTGDRITAQNAAAFAIPVWGK